MVGGDTRLRKTTWYPRLHSMIATWSSGIENATVKDSTICPIIMYDEGKGDPAAINAHPQHASFADTTEPNCFPDSRIEKVFCQLEMWLTKGALETDKIHTLKVGFMPIFTSFLEDITAKDEVTGATVGTILELQTESTDRQCYPLWNTVDMTPAYTNSQLLNGNVPALTGGQQLEAVAFDIDTYYDALQFYTNSGKLKNAQGGLNWRTLTRNRPYYKTNITLRSKNKFLNPYSQFSVMTVLPQTDTDYQQPVASETTAIEHVFFRLTTRYNEWNENFDFARQ